ncbi:hypothetical protein [Muricoccus radiodurans]|uniref:hypothetical protein n=1 Tax=Muricoccus radiodurans TaxID=2231721 RepID=UPI003CF8E450
MPFRPALSLALAAALLAVPALAQVKGGGPAPTAPTPAAPPGPTLPNDLVSCTRIEGQSAGPNTIEAVGYRMSIRDGRLAVGVLDLPGNRTTRTDFHPHREPGVSVRLTAFPRANNNPSAGYSLVFNRAAVEPGGTVLVETWLGGTDRPADPPVVNWYRVRCDMPGGAAPAPGPTATPGAPPGGFTGARPGANAGRKG